MDGFYIADGINAMGYYTEQDLPYYYSLFNDFTLCVNYFYSVVGPTYPNRFYLVGGTSGGITDNAVYGYGVLDYPIILDLLESAGVSWKAYNIDHFGDDTVSTGESDNVFVFFKRWKNDILIRTREQDYLNDLQSGTLPQVSFIIPSSTRRDMMSIRRPISREGWASSSSSSSRSQGLDVLVELGLHPYLRRARRVLRPRSTSDLRRLRSRDARANLGDLTIRQKTTPRAYTLHGSILKFIESVFGLPTLASINHQFDYSTPGGANNEASGGKATGPPAPPRDGLAAIGNLMECFTF